MGPNNGVDMRNEEKVSDDAQVSMLTGSHSYRDEEDRSGSSSGRGRPRLLCWTFNGLQRQPDGEFQRHSELLRSWHHRTELL